MAIEVRVHGRGVVRGDEVELSAGTEAQCSLCGEPAEVVASVGSAFACPSCLRTRLDAISVARYRLREPAAGLPWGKVAG